MVQQKNRFFILTLLMLFLVFACEKQQMRYYSLRVKCYIPYNNTPIKGLKYTIKEYEFKKPLFGFGETKATGWELYGTSGNDGIAETKFSRKWFNKSYSAVYDFSQVQCPYPECEIVAANPSTQLGAGDPEYIEFKVLPVMFVNFHFKNENCVNSSDQFKYKFLNIDDYGSLTWDFPWLEGPQLNGCVDLIGNSVKRNGGRYVFKWEATRGGIFESGIDTFLVSPEVTNTINMFW